MVLPRSIILFIFINYLEFSLKLERKLLFADDTPLYDSDDDLEKFLNKLRRI